MLVGNSTLLQVGLAFKGHSGAYGQGIKLHQSATTVSQECIYSKSSHQQHHTMYTLCQCMHQYTSITKNGTPHRQSARNLILMLLMQLNRSSQHHTAMCSRKLTPSPFPSLSLSLSLSLSFTFSWITSIYQGRDTIILSLPTEKCCLTWLQHSDIQSHQPKGMKAPSPNKPHTLAKKNPPPPSIYKNVAFP